MSNPDVRARPLDAVVDDFAREVTGVTYAMLVSSDGLLTCCSSGLTRTMGDHLAAVVASLCSLTREVARQLGHTSLRQSIIEMDDAYLFLMRVDDDTVLSVVAQTSCDVPTVGGAMASLTTYVRAVLTHDLTAELRGRLPADGPMSADGPLRSRPTAMPSSPW